MMRTTVSTQPQIIIVACCITLRRSAYDMEALRLCVYRRTVQKIFSQTGKNDGDSGLCFV